jgi:uncharacterized protein
MRFDLTRLHGDSEHVERTLAPAAFDPQDEDYRMVAPALLSMDVERAGGGAFRVSGTVTTTLEMACGRCLEPFVVPVAASFELRYVPDVENTGEGEREVAEDDLATAYYRDGELDIVEMLREQLQLALPMKPLCQEDCKGLCPECGANRNRTDCGCAPRWDDPRLSALKGLLARPKEN